MFTFATDYCIAAFISTTGALQFAFSIGGLYGLLVFQRAIAARTLGLALVVAGFVFFFAVGERNINDYEGGLDAPTQALFFFWGALAALVFTLAVTSLVNWKMRGSDNHPHPDLPPSRGKGISHPHPDLPPSRGKGISHPHPDLPPSRGKGISHPHPDLSPLRDAGPDVGIDALRNCNYALALWRSVAYWWKKWKRSRTRTSSYPS